MNRPFHLMACTALLAICSCNNSSSRLTGDSYLEHLLSIDDSGWSTGDILSIIPMDTTEKNLIEQFSLYKKAMENGDSETVLSFMYPDAARYLMKVSGMSNEQLLAYNKIMCIDFKKASQEYWNKGISFCIELTEINRKISVGDSLFYVFNAVGRLSGDNVVIHLPAEANLGISLNNGRNWCFMELDEETPNYLRGTIDTNTINRIMGY